MLSRAVVCLSLVLFAVILRGPTAFGLPEEAEYAFDAGDYAAALIAVNEDQSADAAAFRARVHLTRAVSAQVQTPPAEAVEAAIANATEALRMSELHIEGRLQMAIALSLSARDMPIREARKSGYVEEARRLAESVIADDPQNKYARGFLSVWHLEILQRGGRIGGIVMGASVGHARREYKAAQEIDADDAAIHWQYARALAGLNLKRYKTEVLSALDAAVLASCETEVERVMQKRAIRLQAMIDGGNDKAAQTAAREML